MSQPITLCIVGAGSSYTPELIDGLLRYPHEELPVREIRLTDIDGTRLDIMAGLSQRMIHASGRDITLRAGPELDPLLEGVHFVITQIRVGGMAARHIDESVPLKYGVIGQETTGPGGMFKALRTIGPMIQIARRVEQIAPEAHILSYTNPSGIIAEAVTKHTRARFMGLCSGIPSIQADLKRRLESMGFPQVKTYCVGLNHLGFVHRILSAGRDVTPDAIDALLAHDTRGEIDNAQAAQMRLAKALGAIPISYVSYFLRRGHRVEQARRAGETRAQKILKIERAVLDEARSGSVKPAALDQRGGGGYSEITFDFMSAIHNDTGAELVCSIPNKGSVEGIDDDATVEVACRVDRRGAKPLPVGKIPLAFRGLVQAVKAFESLTVEAAMKQDRNLARLALLNHPLTGDLDVIDPMLDEMFEAHGLAWRGATPVSV